MVGYGMEEKMPDLLAKQVIERLVRPLVNHDKVYSGVSNFYQYIEPVLTQDEQALQAAGINPKEYHSFTIGNVKLGGFSYLEMALILGLGFGVPILFFRVLMQQIHTLLAKKEEIRKLHNL